VYCFRVNNYLHMGYALWGAEHKIEGAVDGHTGCYMRRDSLDYSVSSQSACTHKSGSARSSTEACFPEGFLVFDPTLLHEHSLESIVYICYPFSCRY
jgi:hypothetical protein